MADVEHKDIAAGNVHVPYQWTYVDAATRAAATGFVSGDEGKLALQTDNNSLWLLTATTPTWLQVGGYVPGGTDVAVADGGTGASSASAARTNLGLVIGTDVQAHDADLDTWATKTAPSGTVVGTSDTQTLTGKTLTADAHDSYSQYDEIAAPASPAANKLRVYAKDVGGVTKLHTKDSAGTETELGSGSGIAELDDIPDVNAPSPSNGDVLTWDSTPGEWVATSPGALTADLDDLGDVNAPSPGDGDVLTWDSTPGEWVAAAPAGGGGSASISRGAFASRPAAGNAGALYLSTDTPLGSEDNGTSWLDWLMPPLILPPSSGWSWVNQGGATIDTSKGVHHVGSTTNDSGSWNVRARVRTAPSTPYKITALLVASQPFLGIFVCGLCFRESSSGKLHGFHFYNNNPPVLDSLQFSSPTFAASSYGSVNPQIGLLSPLWMRIEDDGTNRIWSLSGDGLNFYAIGSIGRTNYLTADQVGFHIAPFSGKGGVTLLSWEES